MATPGDQLPTPTKKTGASAWVVDHKWYIAGGAGVIGILIYLYEKSKANSSTGTTGSSTTGSGVAAQGSTPANPPQGGGGAGGGGFPSYGGAAASSFAGLLAGDISGDLASTLAKKGTGNGSTGATTGSSGAGGTGATTGSSSPVVQPKATIPNMNTAAQAAGLSQIDTAEAKLAIKNGVSYYVWQPATGTFKGSRSATIPTGTTLFGNTKSLDAKKIPHAGA
jgi:hypothetical protein